MIGNDLTNLAFKSFDVVSSTQADSKIEIKVEINMAHTRSSTCFNNRAIRAAILRWRHHHVKLTPVRKIHEISQDIRCHHVTYQNVRNFAHFSSVNKISLIYCSLLGFCGDVVRTIAWITQATATDIECSDDFSSDTSNGILSFSRYISSALPETKNQNFQILECCDFLNIKISNWIVLIFSKEFNYLFMKKKMWE